MVFTFPSRLSRRGVQWNDVPFDTRAVILKATKEAFCDADAKPFTHLMTALELIQVPWRENDDFVEEIFLALVRLLSREKDRYALEQCIQPTNFWSGGFDQIRDVCMSRIDSSMLSSIIMK
jgi:hypothetical protein